MTGVTVVLAQNRAVGAADIRGGAPGTRETEALLPEGLNVGVDAIVLSGGSVFGLDAAGAVTNWLAQSGHGFRIANAPMVAPDGIAKVHGWSTSAESGARTMAASVGKAFRGNPAVAPPRRRALVIGYRHWHS